MQFDTAYNMIDLFIAATILIGFILGIWKGFVRSLTALASLVFGVVLAMRYHTVVEPYLKQISSLDPNISMAIAMIIVFVAVQVIFVLIRRVLAALIDVTRLSWLDRILGAAMGVLAGFVVVAIAVQVVMIGVPEWPLVKQSKLVGPVAQLTAKAMPFVPKSAREQLDLLVKKWKKDQKSVPPKSGDSKTPSRKAPTPTPRPPK